MEQGITEEGWFRKTHDGEHPPWFSGIEELLHTDLPEKHGAAPSVWPLCKAACRNVGPQRRKDVWMPALQTSTQRQKLDPDSKRVQEAHAVLHFTPLCLCVDMPEAWKLSATDGFA